MATQMDPKRYVRGHRHLRMSHKARGQLVWLWSSGCLWIIKFSAMPCTLSLLWTGSRGGGGILSHRHSRWLWEQSEKQRNPNFSRTYREITAQRPVVTHGSGPSSHCRVPLPHSLPKQETAPGSLDKWRVTFLNLTLPLPT